MASSWVAIHPPERASIGQLLERVSFEGPSALLFPNGTLRCGARADEALRGAQTTTTTTGASGGLILVHSHRQRFRDFRDHARALGLVLGHTKKPPSFGNTTSLLLINNNAAELFKRLGDTSEDPIAWLRAYDHPSLALRMLLVSSLNLGYFCGELQALAAAAPITTQFAWVLCFSGPDALPTPFGLHSLAHHLVTAEGLHVEASPRPAMLYDWFPAPKHHFRVSMDIFLYWPARLLPRVLKHAASQCISGMSSIPESMLAESLLAHNLTYSRISQSHTRMTTRTSKYSLGWPPTAAVVWHCHNESARGVWLSIEEHRRGINQRERLAASAGWQHRHEGCLERKVRRGQRQA